MEDAASHTSIEGLANSIKATPESSAVGLGPMSTVAPATHSLALARELPDGELPEQPIVEVRVDPGLPLAANSLD